MRASPGDSGRSAQNSHSFPQIFNQALERQRETKFCSRASRLSLCSRGPLDASLSLWNHLEEVGKQQLRPDLAPGCQGDDGTRPLALQAQDQVPEEQMSRIT